MYPLVFATLGLSLFGLWLAVAEPRDVAVIQQTKAESIAANFWAYRDALVAFQNDNYAITAGFVPDGALVAPNPAKNRPNGYFPPGYRVWQTGAPAVNVWKNWFEGGRLYTFSSIPARDLPHGAVDAIMSHRGRSLMLGIRQGDGTVRSHYRLDVPPNTGATFTVPANAAIPDGALVVIGN